eukprot:CAMPEP_0202864322 /NCGR_PEP_ID=MMETSP1391-20130828/4610_1 /ASSEMBLY_ACC=CAM_ASM_000867 /TAXON_ID=1034604 /ORGANISM="Chlamydomonas leiostraca, Strain SAG 11-49" /LENGTH=437 /DNA_ID=CAMNT_0049544057 /DNA_START=121 /DNA_END=1434 /DNA_ORIENTATION=-
MAQLEVVERKIREVEADIRHIKKQVDLIQRLTEEDPRRAQLPYLQGQLPGLQARLAELEKRVNILLEMQAAAAAQPTAAPPCAGTTPPAVGNPPGEYGEGGFVAVVLQALNDMSHDVKQLAALAPLVSTIVMEKFMPTPSRASQGMDEGFKQQLIQLYKRQQTAKTLHKLFCPVLKRFFSRHLVRAAHLFPVRLREYAHLLGIPDINNARNGLLWSSLIEKAWEAWLICFTPCPNVKPGCKAYVLRVVDAGIMDTKLAVYGDDAAYAYLGSQTFRDLDGTIMDIPDTDMPPYERALVWQARLAVFKAQKSQKLAQQFPLESAFKAASPGALLVDRLMDSLTQQGLSTASTAHASSPEPEITNLMQQFAAMDAGPSTGSAPIGVVPVAASPSDSSEASGGGAGAATMAAASTSHQAGMGQQQHRRRRRRKRKQQQQQA